MVVYNRHSEHAIIGPEKKDLVFQHNERKIPLRA